MRQRHSCPCGSGRGLWDVDRRRRRVDRRVRGPVDALSTLPAEEGLDMKSAAEYAVKVLRREKQGGSQP